jgi:hypothetical protein
MNGRFTLCEVLPANHIDPKVHQGWRWVLKSVPEQNRASRSLPSAHCLVDEFNCCSSDF